LGGFGYTEDMDEPAHFRFRLTPDRLVIGRLIAEGLLWLSERFRLFPKGYAVLSAVASVTVVICVMLVWFVVALVFRVRFQFSIRALLVVTVAVALPSSWLAVEMKKARDQREAIAKIEEAHGYAFYNWEVDAEFNSVGNTQAPGFKWLRHLLGDDYCDDVVVMGYQSFSDPDLEHLKGLIQLRQLVFSHTLLTDNTDNELENLKGLIYLESLDLCGNLVSDTGLEHLTGLTQLKILDLGSTLVTDSGLEYLKGLAQLKRLDLDHTQITNNGLEYLIGLTELEELNLDWTNKVTDEGVAKLQQALPNCRILH